MKIELEKLIWGKLGNKQSKGNKESKENNRNTPKILKKIGRMYQI